MHSTHGKKAILFILTVCFVWFFLEANCQRAVKTQVYCKACQKDVLSDRANRQIQEVEVREVSG